MDLIKEEKERAMLRYLRLRRSALLSRWLLEFFAAVTLLSLSSEGLQASFTHFLSLLCRLLPSLLHPLSAFLIGNSIILALVLESNKSSKEDGLPSPPPAHSLSNFDELLSLPTSPKTVLPEEETKEEEERESATCPGDENEEPEAREEEREEEREEHEERESLSVTAEDDGEAFRRRIEDFIAKQLSFIEREEESLLRGDSVILSGSNGYLEEKEAQSSEQFS